MLQILSDKSSFDLGIYPGQIYSSDKVSNAKFIFREVFLIPSKFKLTNCMLIFKSIQILKCSFDLHILTDIWSVLTTCR